MLSVIIAQPTHNSEIRNHKSLPFILPLLRRLTEDEVLKLKSQTCLADDWGNVSVAEGFNCEYVHHTRFSGEVKLGVFESEFTLPGGKVVRRFLHVGVSVYFIK